jgi:DNA-binding GntR family transcriptional regulator
MILLGELRPDQRFTQQELADMIGVSTMPVREALLKLTHDGLIEATPNRSYSVVRTTVEDIRDVYWMHGTLSGELAARACEHVDDNLIAELRSLLEQNLADLSRGDTDAAEATNWEFHRRINRLAQAPKVLLLLRTTLNFIPGGFYALIPEWSDISERGHRRIVQAFEARSPEEARSAMSEHVDEARKLLIKQFSETGYWTPPPA